MSTGSKSSAGKSSARPSAKGSNHRRAKKPARDNELARVHGLHAAEAVLKGRPEAVVRLYAQESRQDGKLSALLEIASSLGLPIERCDVELLDKLSHDGVHQGLCIDMMPSQPKSESELWQLLDTVPVPLILVLDGVQDPHNLGACLRSSDAAGVHAVVAPRDRAVGLTATARKVATGAAEFVPFFQVGNLSRCLAQMQRLGIWRIGTDGETDVLYSDCDFRVPTALVLGSEGKGMRRLTREHCDQLVAIPMAGTVQSLNVSVAAGVCLFEAVRQRSQS